MHILSFGSLSISAIAWGQLAVAFLSPLIGYFVLRKAEMSGWKAAAYILPIIISFGFYASARSIMGEQLYSLLVLGMFLAAATWLITKSRLAMTYMLLFWFFSCLTKTTALPLLLAVVFLYPFTSWLKRAQATAVTLVFILSVLVGLAALHRSIIPDYTSGVGIFAMMNPVVTSREKEAWVFKTSDGPATRKLLTMLSDYEQTKRGEKTVARQRERMQVKPSFFEPSICKKDRVAVPSCLLEMPTLESYWQVKWLAIRQLGIAEADAFLTSVVAEQLVQKPGMFLRFWLRNSAYFLAGGNMHYSYKPAPQPTMNPKNDFNVAFVPNIKKGIIGSFQPSLADNLASLNTGTSVKSVRQMNRYVSPLWRGLFHVNLLVLAFGSLIAIRYLFLGSKLTVETAYIMLAAVFFIYHAFAVSALHPPLGRYVSPLLPVALFGITATGLIGLDILKTYFFSMRKRFL